MLFTIITPCYNSSKTLYRTFQSLCRQNYEGAFEWILVDDCSNDQEKTSKLIKKIAKEAPFKVKFHFLNENYFASKSVYMGAKMASGKYACILDHDDELAEDCLQIVEALLKKYHVSNENIVGICGRCIDRSNKLIGKKFKNDEQVATEAEIRFKQRNTAELFQFTKTEELIKWFSKMKPGYMNGFVWSHISTYGKYVYVNKVFRVYDTELPTSYSNTKSQRLSYPKNQADMRLLSLECYEKFLFYNIVYTARCSASIVKNRLNAGLYSLPKTRSLKIKIFLCLTYPLGLFASYKGKKDEAL